MNNNDEVLELPDELVEQLVCKQLLNPLYNENAIFINSNFEAKYFKDIHLAKLFAPLKLYFAKYNKVPNEYILKQIFKNDKLQADEPILSEKVKELNKLDETKYDKQFLQDTLVNFTKRKSNVSSNIR